MKKATIVAGVLAAALAASVGLAACDLGGGNYSETFEGVVSSQTYASQDAAAKAFIENEIVDDGAEELNVTYTKTSVLTQEEIAALNLGDVKAEDVVTAEKGTVLYAPATSARAVRAAQPTGGKEVSLIILGFEDDAYRYYIPQPGVGEMISKSYLESVCDLSNYKNFTMTSKATTSVDMKASAYGQSQKTSYSTTVTITIKITETAALIEMTTSFKGVIPGEGSVNGPVNEKIYIVQEEDGLVAYYLTEDGTYARNAYEFEDMTSLSELFYYQQPDFDHTLFEKTKTGFKLSPDKFDEYMDEYYAELGDSFDDDMPLNFSGEATYFVTDGRLSKGTAKISAKGGASQDGVSVSVSVGASATVTYTDFGTTTVTLPTDLNA